ncbi:DUF2087 domain-containing protein [Pararhodobacter marinus]|uniref:DUF2087 domain-containing protein n=1 Tax=Pararhodobacter marinus TaxID=2184063 RepID=UPI0035146ABB
MTRDLIPLTTPDVSHFARALSRQMPEAGKPSHLELLNMLARAAGFRNHQHLRAAHAARARLDAPAPDEGFDAARVERALGCFDAGGMLARWPARRNLQILCLWALWARLRPGAVLDERGLNAALDGWHAFGDRALLRRDMIGLGLMTRSPDGRAYRRVEQRPPPEARALIRLLAGRGPR